MRKRIDPTPELLTLGRLQAGVVSGEQALGLGLPKDSRDRLLAEGRWQRLARGLYVVHTEPPTWLTWAWGGVLVGGPRSRIGGQAAAHLAGVADEPRDIEVLVPSTTRPTDRERWRFLREQPGVRAERSPGDPPRLTIEEAVIDHSQRCTEGEVIELVTRAVRSGKTTAERLRHCAAGRTRLRHRRLLLDCLADVTEGARSPLEVRFLRDVERPHGLPGAKRNRRAGFGAYYLDVDYEEYQTVVELDGRGFHDGVTAFRDMSRDNAGTVAGKVTLRYGWFDTVQRSCPMAFQIGHVLTVRGWRGEVRRCPRCQTASDGDLW